VPSIPKYRRALGEAVRQHRKQKNLSQEKLAEKADLSTVFISEVENGKKTISVDALIRIARTLKVDIRVFFRES
jgi:transcriptional regulator with XRE-family HTH domain